MQEFDMDYTYTPAREVTIQEARTYVGRPVDTTMKVNLGVGESDSYHLVGRITGVTVDETRPQRVTVKMRVHYVPEVTDAG